MNAKKIPIESKEQEQELRKGIKGALFIDATNPNVAYACFQCGNIIPFGAPGNVISGNSVQCGQCGAMNTV